MAVTIKKLEIINNGLELSIEVETVIDSIITSISLWDINTFKDYSLSIDLSYKLEQTSNNETFIITAKELNLISFQDIYFIEVEDNYEGTEDCISCQNPALGITYNLQQYYKCMLNYLLQSEQNNNNDSIDVYKNNLTITINLLIDSVIKALEIGFYVQAIEMINELKKLCSITKCNNCQTITCNSCSKFIQG
jgi:hypothetical protein